MPPKSLLEEFSLAFARIADAAKEPLSDLDYPGISISGLLMQSSQILLRRPENFVDALCAASSAVDAINGRNWSKKFNKAVENLVAIVVAITDRAAVEDQIPIRIRALYTLLSAANGGIKARSTSGKALASEFNRQLDALAAIDKKEALEIARGLLDGLDESHMMYRLAERKISEFGGGAPHYRRCRHKRPVQSAQPH